MIQSPPSSALNKPRFASSAYYGQASYSYAPSGNQGGGSSSGSGSPSPLDTYLTSSTPPSPTALHNGTNSHLYYSELRALLQTGQVKEIAIQINPKSFAPLPIAKVMMKNGHTNDLMLPRDMAEFTETLDDAHIPYTYRSTAHEGPVGKTRDLIGNVAEEMLAPFALLGATGLLTMWGMKKFNEVTADREMKQSLMKATRNPNLYPHKFEKMASFHTPHIQEAMEEFLQGTSSVLILKGYPGLGKTHILKSLQNAAASEKTTVLDVGDKKVGKDALDLLSDLYGGDKLLAPKALKLLKQQNQGRMVNEILIVADELEKLDSGQIGTLLTKGTGNPDEGGKLELPKLRLLATCNAWPDFVHDEAVASRIRKEIVPPPKPETAARILADSMHNHAGKNKQTLPAKEQLQDAVTDVLNKYPGYSPRSLTNYVEPALLRDVKRSKIPMSASDIAGRLEERLKLRPLNSTELAGLIVENTTQKVLGQNPHLDKVKGGLQLWNDLHDPAAAKTKDAQEKLILDGRSAQLQIAKALESHDLSIHDPGSIDAATETIVTELKKNRLAALNHVPQETKPEHTVINKFTGFIDEVLKTDEQASKVEKGVMPSAADKAQIAARRLELRNLKTALRQPFQPNSPEAKHLKDAANFYTEIHKETDETKPNFPDKARMQVVMGRALDFNPAKHKPEADYNVIQDENFVGLFKSLRLLATRVNDQVASRLPHRV